MTEKDCKIAIYGAGAMGTVLGVLLTKGGLQKVDLITRNAEHVSAMRKQGATVVCEADGQEINAKVNALLPSEMQEKYDVVFLMTKQRNNSEILQTLLPYLSDGGIVCTMQNGLTEESVAEVVGCERTYGAATSYGATFLEAGRVALTSKMEAMRIEIGGYKNGGEKNGLLQKILSYIEQATASTNCVKTTDNLAGARWSKLAINAAFSGLSVVTGMTFGDVAKKRKTRKIALTLLRECIAVAKASGIKLAPMQGRDMEKLLGGENLFQKLTAYLVLPFAMKKHKKLISGMLKDIENGRKCEIDYINGVVVREGKKVGVATPYCEQIVSITHGIENGLYEIDYKNADFFLGGNDFVNETF